MNPFEPPDSHHLDAAVGWLGLGNWQEANEELEMITASLRAHPDVLDLRFQIYGAAKRWDMAVVVAETLVQISPETSHYWVNRSNALHFLGRYQEAFDQLMPARDRFPKNPIIPYNFACFCCRLDRIDAAREWLTRAFDLPGGKELRVQALNDPDLEPLWSAIRAL